MCRTRNRVGETAHLNLSVNRVPPICIAILLIKEDVIRAEKHAKNLLLARQVHQVPFVVWEAVSIRPILAA